MVSHLHRTRELFIDLQDLWYACLFCLTTVVSRLMNIPIYNHFKLRPAPATKFCFDLWPELPVTNRKRQGEKMGNSNCSPLVGEEAVSL